MEYLVILILTFVGLMLLMQLIFFEMSRSRMIKANNMNWFLSLDKPFNYRRVGYMFFICLICYVFSSPTTPFTASWFIYFVIFLAVGIISDAIVQYLVLIYGKKRCKKDIEEARFLQNELIQLSQTIQNDYETIEETPHQYDELSVLDQYMTPESHLAYLCIDEGKFVKESNRFTEATFDVEPYGDIERTKMNLEGTPVQVTKLTPSSQMPFKDERIDVLMCQYSNYDKYEIQRVLKKGGYFIVNQNGTANLKEFLKMYVPFGMKGSWDAYSCAQTLEDIGMRIIEKMDDYGTVRFRSIQAVHSYFMKQSPDLANINKYQMFYMNALKEIKEKSFYEMTTHRFIVVAQKV